MAVIANLQLIFGSRTKSQEILYLLAGLKMVARQGFFDYELENVIEFCKKNNIYLVKSNMQIIIADHHANYSNKGIQLEAGDMVFLYFSLNENMAKHAMKLEEMHNHKILGMLLGYPSCCVEYFVRNFTESNTDLIQKCSNPYTNLSKRSKDYSLISHFPCNSNCGESLDIANKYLDLLHRVDPAHARDLWRSLQI